MIHEITEHTIDAAATIDLQRAAQDLTLNFLKAPHPATVARGKELLTRIKSRPNWQEPKKVKCKALSAFGFNGEQFKEGQEFEVFEFEYMAVAARVQPLTDPPAGKANTGKL